MRIVANTPEAYLARVEISDARISSHCVLGPPDDEKPFISPGFMDIQLNGFAGVDFSNPNLSPEKAISILPPLWKTGVTTFYPTLITNSHERLLRSFRVLEEARRIDARFAWAAPGYHLEGPYLSPGNARGAHDPKLMRVPDWNEFRELLETAGCASGSSPWHQSCRELWTSSAERVTPG